MAWLQRRSAFNALVAGCVFGALAAGGGVAAILLFLIFFAVLSLEPSLDGLITTFVVGVGFILLAGLLGAVAGLLVAVVDQLVGGRLRDGRMPFWVWLPIGGVMGAASILIYGFFPLNRQDLAAAAFYTTFGALSGFIAGPVFGWLYREGREVAL